MEETPASGIQKSRPLVQIEIIKNEVLESGKNKLTLRLELFLEVTFTVEAEVDLSSDGTFPNLLFSPQMVIYRDWWSCRFVLWVLGLTGPTTGGTSNVHAEILHNKEKNFDFANLTRMSAPEFAQLLEAVFRADFRNLFRTIAANKAAEAGVNARSTKRAMRALPEGCSSDNEELARDIKQGLYSGEENLDTLLSNWASQML